MPSHVHQTTALNLPPPHSKQLARIAAIGVIRGTLSAISLPEVAWDGVLLMVAPSHLLLGKTSEPRQGIGTQDKLDPAKGDGV
jgi:hypothetical protein